ncbi:MAG: hypothetical protein CMM58_09880 [Rhodospirillaceae bacterium]|nr:hypothetical protein [Rhodospirillaceae bacterium]|tara:strand:+ start:973 stop:1740 length:768 start_codon:yes stop_codon:yes gene_type:complete
MKVDINSDLGESWGAFTKGNDTEMLQLVTSANVACGYHAGDPSVMRETVSVAVKSGVSIGAHPSYMDLLGFGRRRIIGDTPAELERQIIYQIGSLQGVAAMFNTKLTHVKSHGFLGNISAEDDDIAMTVARAIKAVDSNLIMVVMPGLATERAAHKLGLRLAREVYADRSYQDNGNLTPRNEPNAVLHDEKKAADRVIRMLEEQAVTSVSGKKIGVRIDTICVHGDNPAAVGMASTVRDAIVNSGFDLKAFQTFV